MSLPIHTPLRLVGAWLACMLLPLLSIAQGTILNQYLPVTAISTDRRVLTCGAARNGNSALAGNKRVLIVQMQKAAYSTGSTETLDKTGNYEVRTINSVSGNSYTLDRALSIDTFDPNGVIQVVSYPEMGDASGHYTPTTALSAANWNGSTGGILAFTVRGTLTLNNNIHLDAGGMGFRGGQTSSNSGNTCAQFSASGRNGEGIVKGSWQTNSNVSMLEATSRKANGGGGGTGHNGGGGGGGNFTAGGSGGVRDLDGNMSNNGLTGADQCALDNAGQGGLGLENFAEYSPGNIYLLLGGGGGGGHQNDGNGTNGGHGGGIIITIANRLNIPSGASVNINAQGTRNNTGGETPASGINENDGAGGGGAGGTIILKFNSCELNGTLNINSSGANGGNVDANRSHGSGGGGGQGYVYYSSCIPDTRITNQRGSGGKNCTTCPPEQNSQPGQPNASTSSNKSTNWDATVLPILSLTLKAKTSSTGTLLYWEANWQVDIAYYDIETSSDGLIFKTLGRVYAKGNSSKATYQFEASRTITPTSFYRLRIAHRDGSYTYSHAARLEGASHDNAVLKAYPSPLHRQALQLQAQGLQSNMQGRVSVFSAMGVLLLETEMRADAQGAWQTQLLESTTWPQGVYLLRLQQQDLQLTERVLVQ